MYTNMKMQHHGMQLLQVHKFKI